MAFAAKNLATKAFVMKFVELVSGSSCAINIFVELDFC